MRQKVKASLGRGVPGRHSRLPAGVAALLFMAFGVASGLPPPWGASLTLRWDYPFESLSPDLSFKVCQANNLSLPPSKWMILTNLPGTQFSVSLPLQTGPWFFFVSASNFWGEPVFDSSTRPRTIVLAWDFPSKLDFTNSFNLYHATDLSIPPEYWPIFTNLDGSARTASLRLEPGVHFFCLTSADPFGESDRSNIISVPPPPEPKIQLSLTLNGRLIATNLEVQAGE